MKGFILTIFVTCLLATFPSTSSTEVLKNIYPVTEKLNDQLERVTNKLASVHSLPKIELQVVYVPLQGIVVTIDEVEFKESGGRNSLNDSTTQQQLISGSQEQKLTIAQKQNLNKLRASARSISHSTFQIKEQTRRLSEKRKTASDDEKKEIDRQLSLLRDKASEFEQKRIMTKAQIDQVKHMQTEKVDIQIKQNIRQTPRQQFYMKLRKELMARVCEFKDLFGSLSRQETVSIVVKKGGRFFEGRNLESVLKISADKLAQCSASNISSGAFETFEY